MNKVRLTIDGVTIAVSKETTVMEASRQAGVYIPGLCYDPDLAPYGACRLCLVEIENEPGLPAACMTPVAEGMVVHTDTARVNAMRRRIVELLLSDHPENCLLCPKNGQCELQKVAGYLGVDRQRFRKIDRASAIDDSNPFFYRDPAKCILCGKCVRVCEEIQGVGALKVMSDGIASQIITSGGPRPIVESTCESCGQCIARCPTGALMPKTSVQAVKQVKTICPYCGVGCGISLGVRGQTVVGVTGVADSPVNQGALCAKGRFGSQFIHHPERLTTPLIKRNGGFSEVGWEEALDFAAGKFAEFKGEETAVIASAKCTNEENYVAQKFARVVLGTNHIDHCARLCHASSVTGLNRSFGSSAMTNSIAEIPESRCILAIGTNTTATHPIIGLKVKKAVKNGARLIVANPLEIDLCRIAHLWLRHRPGSDVALLLGMMRVILEENLLDTAFITKRCENFNAFKTSLKSVDMAAVEKTTGVSRKQIAEAARLYATQKPSAVLYAMGITQHVHGTENVLAIADLAMLTGNLGKPSAGVNPLRGQNNVQGACDMGALPNMLPGYQPVSERKGRSIFEKEWDCSLPGTKGLTLTEIFDAARQKKIKAMYLIGENVALSDPDLRHVIESLEQLEFLAVQDIFLTETARFAHVILPAASFAEKDGSFTNTERRVQRVRRAVAPVGDSRPDWWITCQIARKMGHMGFDYSHPSQIMKEISRVTPIYGGITYPRLNKGGLQWPCPTSRHPGTPILHQKTFTRGKGMLTPVWYKAPSEMPDNTYPLILTTERSLYQYHTGTMTRKVPGINQLHGQEFLRINPDDALALGIQEKDGVRVVSRRGETTAAAKLTQALPPGTVSMTFHFAETPVNLLTGTALDADAKIPELKMSAVRVEKIT